MRLHIIHICPVLDTELMQAHSSPDAVQRCVDEAREVCSTLRSLVLPPRAQAFQSSVDLRTNAPTPYVAAGEKRSALLAPSHLLLSSVDSLRLLWPLVSLEGETPASPKESPKSCSDFKLLPSMGTDTRGGRRHHLLRAPATQVAPHPWEPGEEARDSPGLARALRHWGTKALWKIRQGPSSGEGDPEGSTMI